MRSRSVVTKDTCVLLSCTCLAIFVRLNQICLGISCKKCFCHSDLWPWKLCKGHQSQRWSVCHHGSPGYQNLVLVMLVKFFSRYQAKNILYKRGPHDLGNNITIISHKPKLWAIEVHMHTKFGTTMSNIFSRYWGWPFFTKITYRVTLIKIKMIKVNHLETHPTFFGRRSIQGWRSYLNFNIVW